MPTCQPTYLHIHSFTSTHTRSFAQVSCHASIPLQINCICRRALKEKKTWLQEYYDNPGYGAVLAISIFFADLMLLTVAFLCWCRPGWVPTASSIICQSVLDSYPYTWCLLNLATQPFRMHRDPVGWNASWSSALVPIGWRPDKLIVSTKFG